MTALLVQRAWYDLRTTAHAHGLPFYTRHTKAQAYTRLYQQLIHDGALRRRFKRLSDEERRALITIQAAGGTLLLYRFRKTFGPIRIWRPWRSTIPKQPWKQPISTAEKLWYWGFIEVVKGHPEQVVLPDEVLAWLPPLPRPQPVRNQTQEMDGSPVQRLHNDIAALLGLLLYQNVHPVAGRWLPPTVLRGVNQRFQEPEAVTGIRSELQTGRLRFVHYLAEAAGLIAVQAGHLKPTVQAWHWLNQEPAQRQHLIESALHRDLTSASCLWNRYRLPPIRMDTWTVLLDHISQLTPGQCYHQADFLHTMQIYGLESLDQGAMLLAGPLAWMGWVSCVDDRTFRREALHFAEPQPAVLTEHDQGLTLSLPSVPRLLPLVQCSVWAEINNGSLNVDAHAVRRALERGSDPLQIAAALCDLTGAPLPPATFNRLRIWADDAQTLTLRTVTVLTAHDPAALTRLRADWRLRPFFGELLSSHHAAVLSTHSDVLLNRLQRRGYAVCHDRLSGPVAPVGSLVPELAAYLWLAVRVYQKLGALVSQPISIPADTRIWLEAALTPSQRDGLETVSDYLIEQLSQLRSGHSPVPPPIQPADSMSIRQAVQAAYEQRDPITIEYFSPARGVITRRTIEPTMVYARNGAEYMEAWCQLDGAPRTFRMDRILRVVPVDALSDSANAP